MLETPEFPAPAAPPPTRLPHGLALRPATLADLPLLAEIHAKTRAAELAHLPWPEDQRRAMLDQQFGMQHFQLVHGFPAGDFWVVERSGAPIGRLYADRSTPRWTLIDIMLAAEARSTGTGTALLRWLQAEAEASGTDGIALHVMASNPRARALYQRLGFRDTGAPDGVQHAMAWTP